MITINKWDNWANAFVPVEGAGSASTFVEPNNKNLVMLYVEAVAPCVVSASIEDESIPGKQFKASMLNGGIVQPQEMNISVAGNYRIPIPVAQNEEKVHVTITGSDATAWLIIESEKN